MTETDTSRDECQAVIIALTHDYASPLETRASDLIFGLLARAEKAEAERDTAWNDAIEAAAECVGHITQSEDRDAIMALRKGDPT